MTLTLPFEMSARVAAVPTVALLIDGKSYAGFMVSEPTVAELPAIIIAQCSRCRLTGAAPVRACISREYPSKDRKAA